ncbi:enoyl-CoA hydratase/isomerase family protein [Sphingobium sp. EM0848]|uniref:enoyl-CoA hydratase/isomerase family protein n=1 Tax=Sphingobium sp. EM0848 TaxID=2743473 RepID=UPI00159C3EEA|nr:enoyl-CoA hydratase/isomerase family protein [Sphingobium sp. EM0848]
MNDSQSIIIDRPRAGVAVIAMNRPEARNALNVAMFRQLNQTFRDFEQDADVRAIILTGMGEHAFSAGYDVKELATFDPDEQLWDYYRRDQWMWTIASCKIPVIAALNGMAYGGGATMAITCDMRVGSAKSTFKVTAANYNGVNCTWTLPLIVGSGIAKEWLLTGRLVSAEEALQHGLLNYLVEPDQVLAKAIELAGMIADNPPGGVQGVKLLVDDNIGRRRVDAQRAETAHLINVLPPEPVGDLFQSFLNKARS